MRYQETPTPTSGDNTSPEPPSGGGVDDDRKKRNAASKKCRRLCEPTELGVLRVDPAIHQMWMQKGAARDKLIDAMVHADGDKDWVYKEYSIMIVIIVTFPLASGWTLARMPLQMMCCPEQDSWLRTVETFRESSKVRDLYTEGGYYSEADMKKAVSEGGLGYTQTLGFT